MQVLFPVFLLGVFGFYKVSEKNRKKFIIFYCIIMAIVAFAFQPNQFDDLTREYSDLRGIRQYGWSYFSMKASKFFESAKFEGLYIAQLYYFLFAKLPVSNFLPAVTTFIVYYLQFSIVEKIALRYNSSKNSSFLMFMFVLCTRETYMIMSGIRNQLAFTIAGYFLYQDLVEDKNHIKCWVVYILMLFMHQSSSFIIFFRLLTYIRSSMIKRLVAIGLLFWTNEIDILNNLLNKIGNSAFIHSLIYKINIYTVDNGGNASNLIMSSKYMIYLFAWIPIMLLLFFTIILYLNSENRNKLYFDRFFTFKKNKIDGYMVDGCNLSWFLIFDIAFTIGAYRYYWIYLRAAILLGVLGCFPVGGLMNKYQSSGNMIKIKNLSIVTIFLCMIKLLIIMFIMNRNMDFSLFKIN